MTGAKIDDVASNALGPKGSVAKRMFEENPKEFPTQNLLHCNFSIKSHNHMSREIK